MADKAVVETPANIDSILQEQRKFECPEQFRQQAHIKSLDDYERIYRESVEQPEKFWGQVAEELHRETDHRRRQLHHPHRQERGRHDQVDQQKRHE